MSALILDLEDVRAWLMNQIDGGDECKGRDQSISEHIRTIDRAIAALETPVSAIAPQSEHLSASGLKPAFLIFKDPEADYWFLHGDYAPGLHVGGEGLTKMLASFLPVWRSLWEVAPNQVPEPPPADPWAGWRDLRPGESKVLPDFDSIAAPQSASPEDRDISSGVEAAAKYCEDVLAINHPSLAHAYRHAAENIRAFAAPAETTDSEFICPKCGIRRDAHQCQSSDGGF